MAGPIRIWNQAVPGEFGTLSCLVKWKERYAVLSVAHVLTPTCLGVSPDSRPIVECSVNGSARIGMVRNWDMAVSSAGMPLGFSRDAAMATIGDDTAAILVREHNFLPTATRRVPHSPDETLYFTGVASAMPHATVVQDYDARADFAYKVYELGQTGASRTVDVSLRGLIQTERRSEVIGGDSGSLLRDAQDRAIGILVGVDLKRSYCYFSPLDDILDEFKASLVTRSDPLARHLR